MKILKLVAENIKRLSVVEITPDGALIVIGGKNGAGKSSVLDSIAMALGGAASTPGKPVRTGENHARVVVDLGDIIVTRTFTATGGGSLKVENKEGARFPSPQAMLDKLIGRLSFDPLEFERMKPAQQRDTLRSLVGLDTVDLDTKHAAVFADRALCNKTVKQLEGHVVGLVEYPDVPTDEISIAGLTVELEAAETSTRALDQARVKYDAAVRETKASADALQSDTADLATLQVQVQALGLKIVGGQKTVAAKGQAVETARQAGLAAKAALVETGPIRDRMAAADSINTKVRANLDRVRSQAALETEQKDADALTAQLLQIGQDRHARLSAVTFPVPGLGFDADGVTFDGVPFEQASQAQRLRVSVAMGLTLNPKLKVLLVREGSVLDLTSMALLAELATTADAQVWVERVAESRDGVSVLIEDGTVKAATLAEVAG